MSTPKGVAILLAGGLGTRVRAVSPHLPKPFIPVAGKPFIEWILRYWAQTGLRSFVISLGHLAHVGEEYFRNRPEDGLEIHTISETEPLGTGGAVLYARQLALQADPVLIANGDSIFLADPTPMWQALESDSVDGVILSAIMEDTSRYGVLRVADDGTLLGFYEKRPGRGAINAGVYLLRKRVFDRFPTKLPLSMETEVFPQLIAAGVRLMAHPDRAAFLDIGTPEELLRATAFLETQFPRALDL